MVRVSWHGHACVSIHRRDGYTIVIDPHDGGSLGLPAPAVKGDLILVTHSHFDHNAVDVVKKDKSRVLIELSGEAEFDGVVVRGLLTYHDKAQGRRRGRNFVYVVEVEGRRLAHLGDIGHIPGEEVLRELKGVDLLFVPVGGTFTVDHKEAWEIVTRAQPLNVMPIHYWVRGLNLPLAPVDGFLSLVRGYEVVRLDTNSFDLEGRSKQVIVPSLVAGP